MFNAFGTGWREAGKQFQCASSGCKFRMGAMGSKMAVGTKQSRHDTKEGSTDKFLKVDIHG